MRYIFCLLLCLVGIPALAQRSKVDSLLQELHLHQQDDSLRVNLLVELAYRYYQSQPDSTLYFANLGLTLAQQLAYLPGEGRALNRIAVGHSVKGNLSLALQYYQKAQTIAERTGDQGATSSILNNIGYIHRLQKQYEESFKYTLAAYQISEKRQNKSALAVNLSNLGWLYELTGDYPKALEYANRAIAMAEQVGDSYHDAISRHIAGKVLARQKNYTGAMIMYERGLAIAEKAQLKQQMAFHLLGQGEVHFARKEYVQAQPPLERALAIAQQVNAPEIILEVSALLVRLNRQNGSFAKAFEYDDVYHAAKDTVFNIEQYRQISRLEFEFDSQRKQQELKVMAAERALEANKNRLYLYFLLAAAGAVVLVSLYAALLYFSRGKLKRAYGKLAQQQSILTINHLEISQQKETLLAQADQLRELNRIKDQTFSVIAHDLRSPLGSLKNVIDVLDPKVIDSDELAFMKASLSAQYENVDKALENLLEWSSDQFAGAAPAKAVIRLQALAEEMRQLYAPLAAAKAIDLSNLVPPDIDVLADPNQLRLVLRNLVNNAIKFTPSQGKVEILAKSVLEGQVEVSVQDTGVGIKPERIERLFKFDRQYSTKGTKNELGTGLGLLLCKEFVEKNNGQIWAKSAVGQGSSFNFTLPRPVG
jgi:two-component system, sensor histidine kinase and response regulator